METDKDQPVFAGQQSLDARGNMEATRRPLALPRLDTAPSRALHSMLDQLRSERGAYMSLRIARRSANSPHAPLMLVTGWPREQSSACLQYE